MTTITPFRIGLTVLLTLSATALLPATALAQDNSGLTDLFDFDLINGSNPIFSSIPAFALWAIANLAFMYYVIFKFTGIPPWMGMMGTAGMMLITGIIFQMHPLTAILGCAAGAGISYMVYGLRR